MTEDGVETNGDTWIFCTTAGPTFGRLMEIQFADGGEIDYSYDPTTGDYTGMTAVTDNGNYQCTYTYDASGNVQEVVQPSSGSGNDLAGQLTSSSSNGQAVGSADYLYYPANTSNGNLGDLNLVVTYDAAGDPTGTTYYRYYTGAYDSSSNPGLADDNKYVLGNAAAQRAMTAFGFTYASQLNDLSDTQLAPYADNYYQYDSSNRVIAQTTAGSGTTKYQYQTSTLPDAPNNWTTEGIVTQVDGTVVTSFYNDANQIILQDTQNGGQDSITYNQYDTNGNVTYAYQPSAVEGWCLTPSTDALTVNLDATAGLVQVSAYYTSTTATASAAGGVAGYLQASGVQQGSQGTTYWQSSVDYIARTSSLSGITVYETCHSTQYQGANTGPAPVPHLSDPDTTTYQYTFYPGTQTTGPAIATETTLSPVVIPNQHGSNVAASSTDVYNSLGQLVWSQNATGSISYTAYDPATGAVIEQIQDANPNGNQADSQFQSDLTLLDGLNWYTSTSTGENLVTTYQVDSQGRTIREQDPDGNVTCTVYNDAAQETITYPGWHEVTIGGQTFYETTGPIQASRTDLVGNYTETMSYSWTGTGTTALPTTTITQNGITYTIPAGTESPSSQYAVIQSLSRNLMNSAGQVTQSLDYFSMSGINYSTEPAALGQKGVNYLEADTYYDELGRAYATLDPTGTWSVSFFDDQGHVTSQWQGTNLGFSNPQGFCAWVQQNPWATVGPANSWVWEVSASVYDADGNLVESQSYYDPSGAAAPRTTYYQYDWQDRQTGTVGPDGVATINTLDNLGETTETQTYANATWSSGQIVTSSADLRAQSESDYDSQGRAYESRTYYVAPSSGAVGDYLPTDTWYDANGNVVASRTGAGPIQKSVYNSDGEQVGSYTCADNVPTADLSYAQATSVNNGDTVVEQTLSWYDADGNVIATADYQRLPGDTTTTGPLSAAHSYVTATTSFYDAAGRDIEDVNYGRQDVSGGTGPTAFFNADGTPIEAADGNPAVAEGTPPARQTAAPYTYQVTTTTYVDTSPTGPIVDTTDAAGSVTQTESDLLGHTLRTIQDYTGSSAFGADGIPLDTDTRQDLTTDYQYDSSGRMVTMTVYDAKGEGGGAEAEAEATKYLYGSLFNGSLETIQVAPDSTDDLVPDPTTHDWSTTDDTGENTTTVYNLQGQPMEIADPRGVVHEYTYDAAGRQTADTITSFGRANQDVDRTVNATVTSYDDLGRVLTVSSENGGTILNQVQYAYAGWGNLIQEWQSPNGAVQTTGSGATPSVQYGYDDGAGAEEGTGVAASYVRLTDLTYPSGREVKYDYGTVGAVDDIMSRIGSISDLSGGLASYDYLGAGTVASVSYPQPGLSLDYSADNFSAWDQFGEVLNQSWQEGSTTVDGYSYTYDQSGNRLTRANLTDAVLSESYTYDGLDRLTSVARGDVGSQTQTEGWTLDSLGNFMQSSENGVSQSRTTDAANEIGTITQNSTPNTQAYDAAGNMTTIADPNNPNGTLTCTFDAWNRLTQVKDSNGNTIAQYQYDGTGRLVEELSNFNGTTPGTVTYSFYDGQNAIETRAGTVSCGVVPAANTLSPQYQYVFSPMSGKTPILRDSTFGTGGAPTTAGRLYYTSDANMNVTGLVDASGQVVERYVYSAYGQVTFCDANWAPLTSGGTNTTTTPGVSSAVGNGTLYASMVLDPTTGLFNDEARWYDASVSTFVSQDPAMADLNLYRYCGNGPTIFIDPSGLWEVTRDGGARAKACGDPDDSILGLARKIRMDSSEYTRWLRPTDGEPLPATAGARLGTHRTFSVPAVKSELQPGGVS